MKQKTYRKCKLFVWCKWSWCRGCRWCKRWRIRYANEKKCKLAPSPQQISNSNTAGAHALGKWNLRMTFVHHLSLRLLRKQNAHPNLGTDIFFSFGFPKSSCKGLLCSSHIKPCTCIHCMCGMRPRKYLTLLSANCSAWWLGPPRGMKSDIIRTWK